ncbi:CDK-activating kinase assembly factor MAT1-domain-containing protein [Lipomyces japonicus]|uniref:CDK-activating kinase assembly factor MAT1-domain-containing protein n=1 Tax=Lipomyces japonicus TaxID=56871 RepID=UPI0034D01643
MTAPEAIKSTDDEVCPVCKLDTYMNPSMKFLINTECYHKMCESCVDRIYSTGPAPCPHVNCGRILRKNRFKKQIFADVAVEREVDMRKRAAKLFNRRREDFPSLREYNNYLEEVETTVLDIVNGINVAEAEIKLQRLETEPTNGLAATAPTPTPGSTKAEIALFDPLEGEAYVNELYNVQDQYVDPYLDNIKTSKAARAGGFNERSVYEQNLFNAFMGLGCFVQRERPVNFVS